MPPEEETLFWYVLLAEDEEEELPVAAPGAAARTLDPAVLKELLEEPPDRLVEDVDNCPLVNCEDKLVTLLADWREDELLVT